MKSLQPTHPTNRRIVTAVIDLATQLGVRVVAEGVETEEQEAVLLELGCRYAQGYLYSRPVAAADFRHLLAGQPRSAGLAGAPQRSVSRGSSAP